MLAAGRECLWQLCLTAVSQERAAWLQNSRSFLGGIAEQRCRLTVIRRVCEHELGASIGEGLRLLAKVAEMQSFW